MTFRVGDERAPGGRHLGAVRITAADEDLQFMREELGRGGSGLAGPPAEAAFREPLLTEPIALAIEREQLDRRA